MSTDPNTSSSFSHEIYQNIAIRGLDRFQAKTYSLFIMLLGTFSIACFSFTFLIGFKKFKELHDPCLEKEDVDFVPWFFQSRKIFYIWMTAFFLISFLPFCIHFYDGMKTDFISKKVIYFEYLLKVNGDVINDVELKKIESKFAQIKQVEDYEKVIYDLEKIAVDNKKHINKNPL